MKKLSILTTLLFLLAVTVAPAAAAQQDFPAALEYYDAQINVMLPRLANFQTQYHFVNGRYYQALTSHSTAPAVPTVPDEINASPTDQAEDLALFWEAFASLPAELAWGFRIDTYSGPDGDGYVLTVETMINDQVWMRSINYGPETYRTEDWYTVPAPVQ
jgi:hypothetical protein